MRGDSATIAGIMTIERWLETLAAKQPTPGGGAAAGLAAATAASLVGMVSIYTTGPKWQDREAGMQTMHDQAEELRHRALELMQADELAFAAVGAAYSLPRETEEEKAARQLAIQQALAKAAEPPRQVAVLATEIVTLAAALVSQGNGSVISDVAVAASFARAALEAAIVNIEINANLLQDKQLKDELAQAVEACGSAMQQADAVVAAVRRRMANE